MHILLHGCLAFVMGRTKDVMVVLGSVHSLPGLLQGMGMTLSSSFSHDITSSHTKASHASKIAALYLEKAVEHPVMVRWCLPHSGTPGQDRT